MAHRTTLSEATSQWAEVAFFRVRLRTPKWAGAFGRVELGGRRIELGGRHVELGGRRVERDGPTDEAAPTAGVAPSSLPTDLVPCGLAQFVSMQSGMARGWALPSPHHPSGVRGGQERRRGGRERALPHANQT